MHRLRLMWVNDLSQHSCMKMSLVAAWRRGLEGRLHVFKAVSLDPELSRHSWPS